MKPFYLVGLVALSLSSIVLAEDSCHSLTNPSEQSACQSTGQQLEEAKANMLKKYSVTIPQEKKEAKEPETYPPEAGPITPPPESAQSKTEPVTEKQQAPKENKPIEHYNIFQ